MKKDNPDNAGKYSYDNLTRVIHEKARLGIITSLISNRTGLSFNDLKDLCSLSDGNLSRHMLALENSGLIEVNKGFEGKKPRTVYRITKKGESEFLKYLNELEQIVLDAHKALDKNVKNEGKIKFRDA